MKAVFAQRLKKWMVFAVIGCVAYFVGYVWGVKNQSAPGREPTSVQTAPKK